MRLLDQLTKQHESDAEHPWSADWDNPKISRLLKAIVGFELTVEHWEGKSKLGQNRDLQDRESLKVHLQNSEDASRNKLAKVMKWLKSLDLISTNWETHIKPWLKSIKFIPVPGMKEKQDW